MITQPTFVIALVLLSFTTSLLGQLQDSLSEPVGDVESVTAIYYEKPSLARLAAGAETRQVHKGCLYNKQKYINGQEVRTEQPCLRCLCQRGVLLCALRICPSLAPSNATDRCEVIREPNSCCPTLRCQPRSALIELNGFHVNDPTPIVHVSTMTPLISLDHLQESPNHQREHPMVSVKQITSRNSTILQTVPSSSFAEPDKPQPSLNSPFLVTSGWDHLDRPQWPEPELHHLDTGCYINGTFYAEGSAIIASSYCEYCYCIRRKRMCIRPRCHLSILGCLPRYSSQYACCPTSYACGDDALGTEFQKWPTLYNLEENLVLDARSNSTNATLHVNENSVEVSSPAQTQTEWEPVTAEAIISTSTITTTTTTTTTTSSTPSPLKTHPRMTDCILDGVSYKVGDQMPSNASCTHCYCVREGQRDCREIQCTLHVDPKCLPVIPEGHCCPIRFECPPSGQLDVSENENEKSLEPLVTSSEIDLETTTMQMIVDLSKNNEFSTVTNPLGNKTPTDGEQRSSEVHTLSENNDTSTGNDLLHSQVKSNNSQTKTQEARNLPVQDDTDSTKSILDSTRLHNTSNSHSGSHEGAAKRDNNKYDKVADFLTNILDIIGVPTKLHTDTSNEASTDNFASMEPNPIESNYRSINNYEMSRTIEPVKAMRELSSGLNHIPGHQMNRMQAIFSNGWRAIPNLKVKHAQAPNSHFYVPSNQGRETNYKPIQAITTSTTTTTTTTPIPSATTLLPETITHKSETTQSDSVILTHNNESNNINQAKCGHEGQEFSNGATIPKYDDPCTFCRCFYGTVICNNQTCPPPPSPECKAETRVNQCCPLYTCTMAGNHSNSNADTTPLFTESTTERNQNQPDRSSDHSPIRRAPQHLINSILRSSASVNQTAQERTGMERPSAPFSPPSYTLSSQPRISLPFDPLPRPLELMYNGQLENRIHFPNRNPKPLPKPPSKVNGIYAPMIFPNPHMKQPFLNRPKHPFVGKLNPHAHPQEASQLANNSPIRTLPQSPMQIDRPQGGDQHKQPSNRGRPAPPEKMSTVNSIAPSTTTAPMLVKPSNKWDILQVSGCNISGKMYSTDEEIQELSGQCKKCVCTSMGVQCSVVC